MAQLLNGIPFYAELINGSSSEAAEQTASGQSEGSPLLLTRCVGVKGIFNEKDYSLVS
ncbi:hypothetical protein LCY76_03145 [Fictibacillus sp. KIGAM418]|uniref:Uncharacterized protein n=1 Tax=Fictibacillus marinisediminis TaxID=2878389 RepID=A0A9X1X9G1_9BACL|nr:hypothetical protein [Fictibacillus marinisediminis]MCK6255620.1 hypothetical protein [Fictibacillus marinisediminis]